MTQPFMLLSDAVVSAAHLIKRDNQHALSCERGCVLLMGRGCSRRTSSSDMPIDTSCFRESSMLRRRRSALVPVMERSPDRGPIASTACCAQGSGRRG